MVSIYPWLAGTGLQAKEDAVGWTPGRPGAGVQMLQGGGNPGKSWAPWGPGIKGNSLAPPLQVSLQKKRQGREKRWEETWTGI